MKANGREPELFWATGPKPSSPHKLCLLIVVSKIVKSGQNSLILAHIYYNLCQKLRASKNLGTKSRYTRNSHLLIQKWASRIPLLRKQRINEQSGPECCHLWSKSRFSAQKIGGADFSRHRNWIKFTCKSMWKSSSQEWTEVRNPHLVSGIACGGKMLYRLPGQSLCSELMTFKRFWHEEADVLLSQWDYWVKSMEGSTMFGQILWMISNEDVELNDSHFCWFCHRIWLWLWYGLEELLKRDKGRAEICCEPF